MEETYFAEDALRAEKSLQLKLQKNKSSTTESNQKKPKTLSQSFTKEERIRSKKDYLGFFKKPKVFKCPEFYLYQVKSRSDKARLGITIKPKASSINRNKIKRMIREHFRLNMKAQGTFDYNFVILKDIKVNAQYISALSKRLKNASISF